MFVVVEGIEGSGKSTLVAGLAARLQADGKRVAITREPGGTPLGDAVRNVFLDRRLTIEPLAEAFLVNAARAQHVEEVIRPALEAGSIVLCDRFTDSTLVYQGCGRGLDMDVVRDLDRIACRGLKPDVTFLIDIDLETSLTRAKRRNERVGLSESRIDEESSAFHERVRQGYLALAKAEPDRIVVIDGCEGISEVGQRIRAALGLSTGDPRV